MGMPNRVLMVAFHYPPCRGSSGLQRTLSFSRYLPQFGWAPLVLTANPLAYPQIGKDQLWEIPSSVVVKRALAFDTARHFALGGRYFRRMAVPDRWISWVLGAVPAGWRMIRKYKPKVLWSTYPIASAHVIGYLLHRLTGLPWVADFRDPMTEGELTSSNRFPSDPHVWKANRGIERLAMRTCAYAVFVTPGARRMYVERYPSLRDDRSVIIPNGYDESSFSVAENLARMRAVRRDAIVLVHSGALYPELGDRHPGAFFSALGALVKEGSLSRCRLKVVLRASAYEAHYHELIREHGIEDIVTLEPAIPYHEALAEMLNADGLLVFQGSNCNPNIPAKLYEYLRTRRPVFAMVDANGDTAALLRQVRIGRIVSLQSQEQIAKGLLEFLEEIEQGKAPIPDAAVVKSFSREFGARTLAGLLDRLGSSGGLPRSS